MSNLAITKGKDGAERKSCQLLVGSGSDTYEHPPAVSVGDRIS